jgi:preflagellin peptidase FlaK
MPIVNIVVASVMLLSSSYLDLKKREVPDKFWIIFGAAGVALQVYEVSIGVTSLFYLVFSIVLASIIGMGIFFVGLYGGADGKALIALAILLPYFPPKIGIYRIAPLIVLTNGVLLSMLLPLALGIYNATRIVRGEKIFDGFKEPAYRKLLASFLGYKSVGMPREFQFSMEKKLESMPMRVPRERKFDFALMQDEFESSPGTWVTPGIPLLVFFTAGFFVLLGYGDLVIGLVQIFAHLL